MEIRFPSCWQQYEVVAAMATVQSGIRDSVWRGLHIAILEWISPILLAHGNNSFIFSCFQLDS